MKAPTMLAAAELIQIEAEMERKTSLHDLLQVISGNHPEHGQVIIVRDDKDGYFFSMPDPEME